MVDKYNAYEPNKIEFPSIGTTIPLSAASTMANFGPNSISDPSSSNLMQWNNFGQSAAGSSPAELQLKNARLNGNPGFGGYGSRDAAGNLLNGGNSNLGQTTPWGMGGVGGKAQTALGAFGALGGLYMANEQRKLAASDLDFRRDSFEKQYGNQVATVNDQLYDRQRNRNLRSGMNNEAAGMAADDYVRERGVGQERTV
jgi:hypothetical protein